MAAETDLPLFMASTDAENVLEMVQGDEDFVYGCDAGMEFGRRGAHQRATVMGRLSRGLDESEFDMMPRNRIEDTENQSEGSAGDELDLLAGADDPTPAPFASPAPEPFPVFKAALEHFQAAEPKTKVVRVDTDETYGDFVCERAVKELARRVDDLQAAMEAHEHDPHAHREMLEEHEHDPYAHRRRPMTRGEILGAAEAIADLKSVNTPAEAVDAMPKVPVNLRPEHAEWVREGKIKCWKDGENIVCSIRFAAADGKPRIATMSARPRMGTDVRGWIESGVHPVTILGALEKATDVACGTRLVKDLAGAALKVHRRLDVLGMDEPLLLAGEGDPGSAPLAALMYTEQRANMGDEQAQSEMAKIHRAAQTPVGRKIAAPLLAESHARLSAGRAMKAKEKPTLLERYAAAAGWA